MTTILVPAHSMPQRTPAELIAVARTCLDDAAGVTVPGTRYAFAHLAALRAAAAIIAARARAAPRYPVRRITSVWVLVATVAPELGEWAGFFAADAAEYAARDADSGPVTSEQADWFADHAGRWITVVEEAIGQ